MSKFSNYFRPVSRIFFRSKSAPDMKTPVSTPAVGVSPQEYARTHETVQVVDHEVTVEMMRRLLREDGKALAHNPIAMQVIARYQQFLSHLNPDGSPAVPPENRNTFRGWVNTVTDGHMANRRIAHRSRVFDKKQKRGRRYD